MPSLMTAYWVDQNSGPIFRHLWTKAHKIKFACAGVSAFCKLYGLFVPRTIRTLDYSYYGWTIRTLDDSYDGLFVLWVDYSYLGRFVRWTIRTMDFSYHGLFVLWTVRTICKIFSH